jgi:hypothetical protein
MPLRAKGFLELLAPTAFIKELPMKEAEGVPAGVLLAWGGGGAAGVVEGMLPKSKRPFPLACRL